MVVNQRILAGCILEPDFQFLENRVGLIDPVVAVIVKLGQDRQNHYRSVRQTARCHC